MSSRAPPLPRFLVAATLGFAAAVFELVRRRRRGAIRRLPPVPVEIPHVVKFGVGFCEGDSVPVGDLLDPPVERRDDFFWMRDDERKSEKVLQHLRAENAYTNFKTLPLRPVSNALYKELLSHYVESDSSVPTPRGRFAYYTKTVAGQSYKFHCRKPILADGGLGDEEILLDVNALARNVKHCDVMVCEVSPDDRLLAYSVDTSGYETYEIRFVHLATGKPLPHLAIAGTTGSFEWGLDSSVMFYSTMDDAHRPFKYWRRVFAENAEAEQQLDVCLYTEHDAEYYMYGFKSRSGRFIFIGSGASTTSEHRFIDLHAVVEPGMSPAVTLVRERVSGVLYDVSHAGEDAFYIVTNVDGAVNFKTMKASVDTPGEWTSFLPYDDGRKIDSISCFQDFAVISGREGGYTQIWLVPAHDPAQVRVLDMEDDAHFVSMYANLEFITQKLRFSYASLTVPRRVYELDVTSGERTLLKEDEVPGYDSSLYTTERLEAVSKDGVKIPMSLVYKKDGDGEADSDSVKMRRVLLYGYGSYEISVEPTFAMTRLPLLDRGVVFAIAHVRGGGEFGRAWYEAARLEGKTRTFDDFVACAEALTKSGRTKREWLAIEGRSAGGLLVGAVLNMRPDLFGAAVAGVPFVDVLNTMSDASIPLTTGEWQEWGNPHTKRFHDVMKSYCPCSNVGERDYPAVLVLAGLFDPRVMYSEPAKWVAKLRKFSTGDKEVLLKVDLSSGHFSASNRYHYLREKAFEMAWVLEQLDAVNVSE